MTEQLTPLVPVPEEPDPGLHTPRRIPRALTPFRHAAYRRLGSALVLTTFAQRRLGGRAGLGGDPDRRRARASCRW